MSTAEAPRFILCHKHPTSARLRFLQWPHGVLTDAGLPARAAVKANAHGAREVRPHPAAWLNQVRLRLLLAPGALEAQTEFYEEAAWSGHTYPILLATFTATDPPQALANAICGQFIAITEARNLPEAEMELLRRAYVALME